MKSSLSIVAGLSALTATACLASLPKPRQDYIESRPHGWVEVTVSDAGIPGVPDADGGSRSKPDECELEFSLDGEEFLVGTAYPKGSAEPYSAETGFRFPAPEGSYSASLRYDGCTEGGNAHFEAAVRVSANKVSELLFDGRRLTVLPQRLDTSVTLEDIYEAVVDRK